MIDKKARKHNNVYTK